MSRTKETREFRDTFGNVSPDDAMVIPVMVHLTMDEINAVRNGLRAFVVKAMTPRMRRAAKSALRKLEGVD